MDRLVEKTFYSSTINSDIRQFIEFLKDQMKYIPKDRIKTAKVLFKPSLDVDDDVELKIVYSRPETKAEAAEREKIRARQKESIKKISVLKIMRLCKNL